MRRCGQVLAALGLVLAAGGQVGCARGDDAGAAAGGEADQGQLESAIADWAPTARAEARDAASLIRVLGCAGCHVGVPAAEMRPSKPLTVRDRTRDPALTFGYLRDSPRATPAREAHSPSFHLDDAEALALSLYLAGGSADDSGGRDRFDVARQRHGEVDAEAGARIFRALNCAACHAHERAEPRPNGPPLAGVVSRLRPAVLRDFLLHPRAVRPFGFEPGSGGRMPDFALTAAEVDSIVAFLGTRGVQFAGDEVSDSIDAISTFGVAKARALLERKLTCLGCHALNGEGGRVGPDLAYAGERLLPEYLAAIIDDPQHAMPATVMPPPLLARATRDLIVAFLAGGATGMAGGGGARDTQDAGDPDGETGASRGSSEDSAEVERAGYLSLIDHPITPPAAASVPGAGPPSDVVGDPAASLYAARCAMCHGADGRGDGYNARYLRVQPAIHASADSMSRRPDDTLFDAIHAGGAILDGSPEMPAFGENLSAAQIEGLVDYIRKLCNCRQPAWADDG